MADWNVYVPRLDGGKLISAHVGAVNEDNESLARCAALSKFGMSDDEYFEAVENGVDQPLGSSPGDDFSVSRA